MWIFFFRLDIAVSKGMNHLLKAPFCVHPKTGRICVPFNPEQVDQFNPEEVRLFPLFILCWCTVQYNLRPISLCSL